MGCRPRGTVFIGDKDVADQLAGVTAAGELRVQTSPEAVASVTAQLHSVSTTEQALLAPDPDRVYAAIQNHTADPLTLRFSSGGDGVFILPQYGSLRMGSDHVLVTSGVWGIRASGTGNVGVVFA